MRSLADGHIGALTGSSRNNRAVASGRTMISSEVSAVTEESSRQQAAAKQLQLRLAYASTLSELILGIRLAGEGCLAQLPQTYSWILRALQAQKSRRECRVLGKSAMSFSVRRLAGLCRRWSPYHHTRPPHGATRQATTTTGNVSICPRPKPQSAQDQ